MLSLFKATPAKTAPLTAQTLQTEKTLQDQLADATLAQDWAKVRELRSQLNRM